MRLSLTRLRRRAADAADEVAGGSAVPAGAEPEEEAVRRKRPSARERGAMRRRARQLRRRREAMLLELGALLFEMHRRNRRQPELLERKAEEIRAVDDEERGLTEALGANARTVEIVAAGIAGTCPSCSALVSTDARFCERCGTPLGRSAKTHEEPHTEELQTPERAERDATVRRPTLRRR
jgi:hypothetical protein